MNVRAIASHFASYARRVTEHASTVRRFWFVVVVLGVALAGILWLRPVMPETRIRWAGMLLQLLGIGAVMRGLVGKGKLFGLPHPLASFQLFIKQWPKWVPGRPEVTEAMIETIDAADRVNAQLSGSWARAQLRSGC